MSEISSIRGQLAALRAQINAEKEAEYVARSLELRTRLDDTLYYMHVGGASVNAIAKAYGTKNWLTVKEAINRASVRHNAGTGAARAAVQMTGDNTYSVMVAPGWTSTTGQEYAGTIAVKTNAGLRAVLPDGEPTDTPLHRELADWRNRTDSPVVRAFLKTTEWEV